MRTNAVSMTTGEEWTVEKVLNDWETYRKEYWTPEIEADPVELAKFQTHQDSYWSAQSVISRLSIRTGIANYDCERAVALAIALADGDLNRGYAYINTYLDLLSQDAKKYHPYSSKWFTTLKACIEMAVIEYHEKLATKVLDGGKRIRIENHDHPSSIIEEGERIWFHNRTEYYVNCVCGERVCTSTSSGLGEECDCGRAYSFSGELLRSLTIDPLDCGERMEEDY